MLRRKALEEGWRVNPCLHGSLGSVRHAGNMEKFAVESCAALLMNNNTTHGNTCNNAQFIVKPKYIWKT